ncbi:MAG: hypothetical protein EBV86_09205 [Marivivens sp.]|nr:hypothetical protein [Marivivens sp.]NCW68734.1 hypothetical protein [Marivivens sp.]
MVSSLSQLQKRAERIRDEIQRRKARSSNYTTAHRLTELPGVDRWPSFARRTWIRSGGGVTRFEPYPYQAALVESINAHPNTIINKSRQMGASETICSYLLCRALTERGFAAVIFSKTQQDASELGRRVRAMANSIEGESIRYLTDSNTQIAIEGRGTLYFLPASPRAARGIPSCSVLFMDEGAFLEGAAEIYRGAMPTLSMVGEDAKVIVTSTPDTELDWFGQLWHQGTPQDWYSYVREQKIDHLNELLEAVPDSWNRVAMHYSQHPIYGKDKEWAAKTRESRRMTQSAWDSEYELAFGATDTQVYPSELVLRAMKGHWRECGSVGRNYVIGIDPNAGGQDYFVAICLDISQTPYEVVAMYRENGKSTDFSLRHVKELIEDYQPSRVIVEKQAMGAVIAEALQHVLPEYAIETFSTSRPSKTIATDRILYLLERDELIFPQGVIGEELRAFQQKDSGAREAASGAHDDTVMALSFACSLIPETPNTAGFFAHI